LWCGWSIPRPKGTSKCNRRRVLRGRESLLLAPLLSRRPAPALDQAQASPPNYRRVGECEHSETKLNHSQRTGFGSRIFSLSYFYLFHHSEEGKLSRDVLSGFLFYLNREPTLRRIQATRGPSDKRCNVGCIRCFRSCQGESEVFSQDREGIVEGRWSFVSRLYSRWTRMRCLVRTCVTVHAKIEMESEAKNQASLTSGLD